MIEEEVLEIYVDGSTSKNNEKGGVGIRIVEIDSDGEEVFYDLQSIGYQNVKSGQMEIVACTYALSEAMRLQLTYAKRRIIIFSDSRYVADNYKKAMFEWSKNQWLWWSGRPVMDAAEWKELVKQLQNYSKLGVNVEIKWVKGHGGSEHNIAAHDLAKDATRVPSTAIPKNKILSIFRPKKLLQVAKREIGSVKMEGQRISIMILDHDYLKLQRVWNYKYMVISKNSPYFNCVDKIFSHHSLDVGESYYVKLNSNKNNPQIEKVYRMIQ